VRRTPVRRYGRKRGQSADFHSALGATNGSKPLGMANGNSRLADYAETADRQADAPALGRDGNNPPQSHGKERKRVTRENLLAAVTSALARDRELW
jgi:hypothetical protein